MKDVYEGQRIDPATDLFTVSDLSKVWVEADFYQSEAPDVRVGLTANSFSSLSLDPPLVLWSLRRQSPSRAATARNFRSCHE